MDNKELTKYLEGIEKKMHSTWVILYLFFLVDCIILCFLMSLAFRQC